VAISQLDGFEKSDSAVVACGIHTHDPIQSSQYGPPLRHLLRSHPIV
jgi:hypothetical protein